VVAADEGRDAAPLAALPPLGLLLPVVPGPDDRVLLQARPARGDGAPEPLLVVGSRGEGRVVWFGGRRLWELAFWEPAGARGGAPDQPVRRLLRNLLVWTASGREEAGLALVGRRSVFQEGERVRLEARWRDMRGDPVLGRRIAVELRGGSAGADTTVRRFSLAPVPGRAGSSEAFLPPLPPGRYEVRPVSLADDVAGAWQPLVVTASSLERAQVRQDRRRLRQLAAAVGGSYHDASQPGAVDALLRDLADLDLTGEERERRSRWEVWAGWPLLGLAALLLGAEWLLRRRNGLL
jgi:hypothetical protein